MAPPFELNYADADLPLPFALAWRKDNVPPLLTKFVADVRLLPEMKHLAKAEIRFAGVLSSDMHENATKTRKRGGLKRDP